MSVWTAARGLRGAADATGVPRRPDPSGTLRTRVRGSVGSTQRCRQPRAGVRRCAMSQSRARAPPSLAELLNVSVGSPGAGACVSLGPVPWRLLCPRRRVGGVSRAASQGAEAIETENGVVKARPVTAAPAPFPLSAWPTERLLRLSHRDEAPRRGSAAPGRGVHTPSLLTAGVREGTACPARQLLPWTLETTFRVSGRG